jgi:hypothetical protein
MKENKVGKIKSIKYNEDTDELEFTIAVTDPIFKKKLLRDLALSGKLKIVEDKIFFEQEDDAAI